MKRLVKGKEVPYKEVTKDTKRKALELLIETKNNYDFVSSQTGVSIRTLKRWNEKRSNLLFKANNDASDITELLKTRIKVMIEDEPETNKSGWAMAIGIFVDKMLLLEGKPTSRHQNISSTVDNASDDELDDMIAEAEAIVKARMKLQGTDNIDEDDSNGLSSTESADSNSMDIGNSNTASDDAGQEVDEL